VRNSLKDERHFLDEEFQCDLDFVGLVQNPLVSSLGIHDLPFGSSLDKANPIIRKAAA
jgi:hypothetical protein